MKLAWRRATLFAVGIALMLVAPIDRAAVVTAGPQPLVASCPPSLVVGGHDYHGLALTMCNFNGLDLGGANFAGATLTGVAFIRAKLKGADFSDATVVDSGDPVFPTDFSFADLEQAKFVGTRFGGPTYFTYATLSCADFSGTMLNDGNAIFGDSPLKFDAGACRPRFVGATMNCEFVAQWALLDLSHADIAACTSLLKPGQDFSGAMFSGVVFDGLDLGRTRWTGAVLEHASFQGATLDRATGLNGTAATPARLSAARFNNASLRNVDMSHAQLYGANFTQADLSDSSLAGSFLTSNTAAVPPIETAAVFDAAHLKDVNLAGADLSSVSFKYASFYGSFGGASPKLPCATDTTQASCKVTGFTCACATAAGATLTNANFSNAFLFGVDFMGSTTTINGTQFGSAILVGASFDGANFSVNGGASPELANAMLSGTRFGSQANLSGATMTGAFLDFGASTNQSAGNILYVTLSAEYTRFRNWSGATAPCVQMPYKTFSEVSPTAAMTCPNGLATTCGAGRPGPPPRGNPNWNGGIAIGTNAPVPGWYFDDATYDLAPVDTSVVCNGSGMNPDPKW